MTHHCILEDDLVFYALGELNGPRRTHLEAHLALCPECRKRTGQYQQVRRHLRESSSQEDIALHRALLTQRLLADAGSEPAAPVSSTKRRSLRWQPVLVAVIVIVIGGMLATVTDVDGRFPFSRHVGFKSTVERPQFDEDELRDLEPPWKSYREALQDLDTGAPVPDGWQTPDVLPLGLYLDESFVMENSSVVHYYLSRDYGFELAITLADRATSQTQIAKDDTVMVSVDGVPVLIDGLSTAVASGLLWQEDNVVFSAYIEQAFGGLTFSSNELLTIAEAVIRDREVR